MSSRVTRFLIGCCLLVVGGASVVAVDDASAVRHIWTVPGTGPETLNKPWSVVVDADHLGEPSFVVADTGNHRVVRIALDGTMTVIAGTGEPGFNGDGNAAEARLDDPHGVALMPDRSILIADTNNHRIRRVFPGEDGTLRIETIAGTGEPGSDLGIGVAKAAQINQPYGIVVERTPYQSFIWFVDRGNHRVLGISRVVGQVGIMPYAGTGEKGFSGDGDDPKNAKLNEPSGIAMNSKGELFIADTGNHRIRKVFVDGENNLKIETVSGTGQAGYGPGYGPGGQFTARIPADKAQFDSPCGVAVGLKGEIYVADTLNNLVRVISKTNNVFIVAGTGSPEFGGDNQPASKAPLFNPTSVVECTNGTLLVTDAANNRLRLVADPETNNEITQHVRQ